MYRSINVKCPYIQQIGHSLVSLPYGILIKAEIINSIFRSENLHAASKISRQPFFIINIATFCASYALIELASLLEKCIRCSCRKKGTIRSFEVMVSYITVLQNLFQRSTSTAALFYACPPYGDNILSRRCTMTSALLDLLFLLLCIERLQDAHYFDTSVWRYPFLLITAS